MSFRSVLTHGSSLLLVLAVAALAVFAIGPHTGLYRTASVLSNSMAPSFSAGDAIVLRPMPASDVRVGDVITYHAPVAGRPIVTHRVIEVGRDGDRPTVRTRGDANDAADPWDARLEDRTAWRQVAVVPYAGHVIVTLRRGAVQAAFRYGAPALLLLTMLASIWGVGRRQPEQAADTPDRNAVFEAVIADLSSRQTRCAHCAAPTAHDPCSTCGRYSTGIDPLVRVA